MHDKALKRPLPILLVTAIVLFFAVLTQPVFAADEDKGDKKEATPAEERAAARRAGASRPEADPGEIWVDPVTKMEFVWVSGGCFNMGTPGGEPGRESDEGPVHKVCVDGFWMGRYPVTNRQFRMYDPDHASRAYFGHSLDGADQPVVYVSWEQARAFARWLTRRNREILGETERTEIELPANVFEALKDGKDLSEWLGRQSTGRYSFFLPTEAEWEYACRAGTTTTRFWGDGSRRACEFANVADHAAQREWKDWRVHDCDDGHVVTSPVGSRQPNPWGLYDMLGNVWEWCLDWYSEQYDPETVNNPTGPPLSGIGRQVRGGSWDNDPHGVRCGNRSHASPRFIRYNIGFRLVRTR